MFNGNCWKGDCSCYIHKILLSMFSTFLPINLQIYSQAQMFSDIYITTTVRSESRCALRLRHIDFVVTIEVTVELCWLLFYCIQMLNSG
jgi:hypothetical protein